MTIEIIVSTCQAVFSKDLGCVGFSLASTKNKGSFRLFAGIRRHSCNGHVYVHSGEVLHRPFICILFCSESKIFPRSSEKFGQLWVESAHKRIQFEARYSLVPVFLFTIVDNHRDHSTKPDGRNQKSRNNHNHKQNQDLNHVPTNYC
jgi:hypothetical protein